MAALLIEKLVELLAGIMLAAGFRSLQWFAQTVLG